jgi:uncharacterized protein YbjQ (UPF0145 family)
VVPNAGKIWRAGARAGRSRCGGGDALLRMSRISRRPDVLITTTNDLPGYRVTDVYGEVFGLTVRSRNVASQIGATLKSLAGGELKGMTKNLIASRHEAIERMIVEAQTKGANAILAMRFDISEMGSVWTEIAAYGTAVRVEKL